ncbi:aspartate/glutamate racemase family protein (plasmid) [Tistrella bauzanensis]|uniref:aspartate/glutamate racemase family protein n=1 Tax=Tistrella TaxID=171436 RepID=UPI0031F65CC8
MTAPIGLVGGTGWPSTALYYTRLNRLVEPDTIAILVASLSFQPILDHAEQGRLDLVTQAFVTAAQRIEAAGAGVVGLCAATAHLAYDAVAAAVSIPCCHIASPFRQPQAFLPAGAVVGVLGTLTTLDQGIFGAPLAAAGHVVLSPAGPIAMALDRAIKHDISAGHAGDAALAVVQAAIDDLAARGATHIVLGCTELPLIRDRLAVTVPLLDAVDLHCRALLTAAGAAPGGVA